MMLWKVIFRALLRRNEYKCDELSFRYYPTGCFPFMECEILPGAGADISIRAGKPVPLPWWKRFFFLLETHPPLAERFRRMRQKIERENLFCVETRI